MPFRKIGKNKWRSPSGRIFTTSQVRRYYARGRSFDGRRRLRKYHRDSDDTQSRDPTGTGRLRLAWRSQLDARWRVVSRLVREATTGRDYFGVRSATVENAGIESPVEVFSGWLSSALDRSVLQAHGRPSMRAAYDAGERHASATVGRALTGVSGKTELLAAVADAELRGVTEATRQQATRAFADVVIRRGSAREAGQAVQSVLDRVGRARSRMLADYMTVRAHAEGTLDAFQSGGIERVGLMPEHLPRQRVGDAYDPNQPRAPAGTPEGGQWVEIEKGSKIPSEPGEPTARGRMFEITTPKGKKLEMITGWDPDTKTVKVVWLGRKDPDARNFEFEIGPAEVRAVFRMLKEIFPRAEYVEGERITGARTPDPKIVRVRLRDWLLRDARRRGPRGYSRAVERENRRISRLGSPVSVETAGDDRVCEKCEEIAAGGPYPIDRARGLIPAHPHCRCVFVPAAEGVM